MKRNTGAETGTNRPVIAEELKSRSRCNGHPISMSAKSVAAAFASCEKAMKTFLKEMFNLLGYILQIHFMANSTGTVTILGKYSCSKLTPGGVYEGATASDVS
jgi:hypothetical protein